MAKKKKANAPKSIHIKNKKAFYQYEILEKVEAGLELRGTEVKSLREGNMSLGEAYARIQDDEVFLVGSHIGEYRNGSWANHDPVRKRKLLLHRREIQKIRSRLQEKGLTLVPLRVYFNSRGFAKCELGIGKGKKLHDKRESIKKRDVARDVSRELAGR